MDDDLTPAMVQTITMGSPYLAEERWPMFAMLPCLVCNHYITLFLEPTLYCRQCYNKVFYCENDTLPVCSICENHTVEEQNQEQEKLEHKQSKRERRKRSLTELNSVLS